MQVNERDVKSHLLIRSSLIACVLICAHPVQAGTIQAKAGQSSGKSIAVVGSPGDAMTYLMTRFSGDEKAFDRELSRSLGYAATQDERNLINLVGDSFRCVIYGKAGCKVCRLKENVSRYGRFISLAAAINRYVARSSESECKSIGPLIACGQRLLSGHFDKNNYRQCIRDPSQFFSSSGDLNADSAKDEGIKK